MTLAEKFKLYLDILFVHYKSYVKYDEKGREFVIVFRTNGNHYLGNLRNWETTPLVRYDYFEDSIIEQIQKRLNEGEDSQELRSEIIEEYFTEDTMEHGKHVLFSDFDKALREVHSPMEVGTRCPFCSYFVKERLDVGDGDVRT